jgi:acetyl-CoA/propionyl-CoA/long-chain acyl-CoA carboxylase, biotin carboxylase, biotin carboxyl carrier protein
VRTTLPLLRAVLAEPAFTVEGPGGFAVHTRWIEQDYLPDATASPEADAATAGDAVMVRVGSRWLPVAAPGLTQAREGPLALARQQARERRERVGQAAGGVIGAPMQGTVVRIMVAEGEDVEAGQVLAVVEAMKMENPVRAPHAGQVTELRVSPGQTVTQGAALCRII